jgi:hypothetical protein
MIRFQIPSAYLSGFETLLKLQSDQIDQIIQFLKTIPVGTGPKTFGELFDDYFEDQSAINHQLANTLYSLGSFKLGQDEKLSFTEIIEGLTHSFASNSQNEYNEDDLKRLSENLTKVLQTGKKLTITFKAFNLLSANESIFRENQIITDIRLLFNEQLEDNDRHGLVIHQLKLNVEENGEQNDYYFSLTITDLQKLQEQITRAIEKERLIKEDYKNNISFINITE